MTGYGFATGACGACSNFFTFHPTFVPSLNNIAFCDSCMARVNAQREDAGLEPHPIHPKAYEIFEESEL